MTLAAFGYVSFAVAVGALYFWMFYDMGSSSARYRVEQEQASQAYAESASKEVYAECSGRSDRATCEREIEDANREGQKNQQDLEAQRGMSDWAFWLLVISAFQLPATLAALVFVKRTLDATLEAVKDTGKATKAMERQNKIAEQAQRAWVRIDVEPFDPVQYSVDGRPYTRVAITLRNIGKAPARNILIECELVLQGVEGITSTNVLQRLVAQKAKLRGRDPDSNQFGYTLFPDQPQTLHMHMEVSEPMNEMIPKTGDMAGWFLLGVVGAVDYALGETGERGHTGFNVDLFHFPPPRQRSTVFMRKQGEVAVQYLGTSLSGLGQGEIT